MRPSFLDPGLQASSQRQNEAPQARRQRFRMQPNNLEHLAGPLHALGDTALPQHLVASTGYASRLDGGRGAARLPTISAETRALGSHCRGSSADARRRKPSGPPRRRPLVRRPGADSQEPSRPSRSSASATSSLDEVSHRVEPIGIHEPSGTPQPPRIRSQLERRPARSPWPTS